MAEKNKWGGNQDGSQMSFDFSDQMNLDPFAGTAYEQQARELAARQYSYNMGPWESFIRQFGARTGFDKYKEATQQDALGRYNDLLGKLGDIRQNSPASKAAQMYASGQNPDLLGTEGVANAPSIPADPVQAQPSPDSKEQLQGTMETVGSILQTGLSIYSTFQNLNILDMDIYNRGVGLARTVVDSLVRPGQTYEMFLDDYKRASGSYDPDVDVVSRPSVNQLLDLTGHRFSRKHADAILTSIERYINSEDFQANFNEKHKKTTDSILALGESLAHPAIDGQSSTWKIQEKIEGRENPISKAFNYFEPLIWTKMEDFRMGMESRLSENIYKAEYWNNRDGGETGKFDQDKARYDHAEKKEAYDFNYAWRKVLSNLQNDAAKGDDLAMSILLGMVLGDKTINILGNFSNLLGKAVPAKSIVKKTVDNTYHFQN